MTVPDTSGQSDQPTSDQPTSDQPTSDPVADDQPGQAKRLCEACSEPAPTGMSWCEACGHQLGSAVPIPCVACGALDVDELGYCLSCGHRQPLPGDHVEVDLGPVAAVSDRGRRHRSNEDAVAVAHFDETIILVVCDGVSATKGSAEASRASADAARDYLSQALKDAKNTDEPEPSLEELLTEAVAAAQAAASACVTSDVELDPQGAPSTTFVASVIQANSVTTAWVGDSRSYWVGAEARKLTGFDHEIGGSLAKWLGADSIDSVPEISTTAIEGPGYVVVCSDGLWRYAPEASDLAALLEGSEPVAAIDRARALVEHANESGGHDNISVAIYSSETGESKA